MTDYTKLVKSLLEHAKPNLNCRNCQFYDAEERGYETCSMDMAKTAAAAIEYLQAEVKRAAKRNAELHAELEKWVSAAEMAGLVVRCKECIHFAQGGWCDREFDWFPVDENDFCSMAEKMEAQDGQ